MVAETTWQMQRLATTGMCRLGTQREANDQDPGLNVKESLRHQREHRRAYIATGARPKLAVLREQGVNSHVETAAAFHRWGLEPSTST
ncbi:hypothetical protein ACNKHS_15465 [Shigella flexneri]